jgi:hypothetical protein
VNTTCEDGPNTKVEPSRVPPFGRLRYNYCRNQHHDRDNVEDDPCFHGLCLLKRSLCLPPGKQATTTGQRIASAFDDPVSAFREGAVNSTYGRVIQRRYLVTVRRIAGLCVFRAVFDIWFSTDQGRRSTEFPPQLSGSTSAIVWVKSQRCPQKSCALYCRSP